MDSGDGSSGGGGEVGLVGAMAIGIGGMVGGGIFAVLGEAVSLAHGGTLVAFLVAGVLALLTASSYARLSVRFPAEGGTLVFIDRAFGGNLTTGIINLILWLSYLVTLALYAVAFGSYALTFFPGKPPWLEHVLISAGILVPVVINLVSAELVSRSEAFVVSVKLVLLTIIIVAGVPGADPARVAPSSWGGPIDLITSGLMIFVAYEGFELIANAARSVKDPARTLPRAYFGSVGLVIVLYLAVAYVTVGSLPEARIIAAKDYALAEAARPALGQFGFVTVAIAALLATLSAINATIYGSARLGFSLAKDGELPRLLDKKTWNQPAAGVLVVGGLSLLMANLIDLASIAIIASAGFLLIFALTNAAAVKLAPETGGSRVIASVATVACAGALVTLLIRSALDKPSSILIFLGFIAVAVLFEFTWGRIRGKIDVQANCEKS